MAEHGILISEADARKIREMWAWYQRRLTTDGLPFRRGPRRRGGGDGELPTPQYPLMVYQGVAHNVGGFDWVRYAPLSAPTEP